LNAYGTSCAWVESEILQVAALPSSVMAGIWNVCAVLPGMNAEYIGENTIPTVGFAQDPGAVVTVLPSTLVRPPSSPPLELPAFASPPLPLPPPPSFPVPGPPPSTPLLPPADVEPSGLAEGEGELLLQAAKVAPSADAPAIRPKASKGRFEENCTGDSPWSGKGSARHGSP